MTCETDKVCIRGEAHHPGKRRRLLPRYWLYQAASDGCLPCVQRLVREDGIDPHSTSESQGNTALACAVWAKQKGVAGGRGSGSIPSSGNGC